MDKFIRIWQQYTFAFININPRAEEPSSGREMALVIEIIST